MYKSFFTLYIFLYCSFLQWKHKNFCINNKYKKATCILIKRKLKISQKIAKPFSILLKFNLARLSSQDFKVPKE